MMDGFVTAGLVNGGLAALVACVALLMTKLWRNPYFARIAWLAVLLKFVTPPMLFIPVAAPWLLPPGAEIPATALELIVVAEEGPRASTPAPLPAAEAVVANPADADAAPATAWRDNEPPTAAQRLAQLASQLDWSETLQPLGVAWLAGSALLGCLALLRIYRFHRLVSRSALAPASLLTRTEEIAARLGLRATPRVWVVPSRIAPLVWSLGRRSTIVVPTALVESLDGDAMDAIIAHELTHLKRRDGWARWLELAAVIAYWWHPVAWFARRCVHEAEEQCCDADALRSFPTLRRGYGRALIETLELLASDSRLVPGATGWGSRRSLRRRFELIGRQKGATPLRAAVRSGCWAVIAILCVSAPIADSSEPTVVKPAKPLPSSEEAAESDSAHAAPPDAPTTAKINESTPCIITLEDGSIISGMLIDQGEEKLVVLREPKSAEDATTEMRLNPPPGRLPSWKTWDLTLAECIRLTFTNHRGIRVMTPLNDENRLTIAPAPDFWASTEEFRSGAADQLRDVVDCYAELHFAYEDLASRRTAEADSLQTWRRVKAKFVVGAEGGEEAAETQSRSQYFHCRAQVETAQTSLLAVENRLRYLIGLAASDGRLIRPSTPWDTDEHHYDWKTIHAEALVNRTEIRNQRKIVEDRQRSKAVAEAAQESDLRQNLRKRLAETVAHHSQLLTTRETEVLRDIERTVSHQLGAAVRDVDLAYGVMKTNANRRAAAEDDVVAVRAIYDIGRVSVDLLLQSIQRRAESETAHQRSLADYARAKARVEYRKGTLLEAYDIHVAE